MLDAINLVLIVIIIIAIVVNTIMMYKARNEMNKRIDTIDTAIKTQQDPAPTSILDHAEFEKLDPEFKELYRKYIVQHIMPRAMNIVNKEIADQKINDYLKTNGEYLIQLDDKTLFSADAMANLPDLPTST